MGTWGVNNFDNDDANEFLDKLISRLVTNVKELMGQFNDTSFLMRKGEKEVIPSLDIIITLCNHYNMWTGIEASEIISLKEKYLEVYDKNMVNYAFDEEYVQERREVIVQTFDSLQKIATKWD